MTVKALKELLETLSDDTEVMLDFGDVFLPACETDSKPMELSFVDSPRKELALILTPCTGHDNEEPEFEQFLDVRLN